MKYDYRIFSKNIYGITSAIFWLLTSFLFAIDIIHYFKLYSHLKQFKVTSLNDYLYDLQPTLTLTLIIGLIFVLGALLFFGNLVYLTYRQPKELYTFILPLITMLIVLAAILPLTQFSVDLVFQIPEPLLTDSVLGTMSNDLLIHLNRNLPYGYTVFWMQLVSPLIASVFQYLGIKKIKKDEEDK
ncbi:MAG: hypothetical protein GPJ51_10785 [Candidatus Heimdallarchaeota archaeon]|nr:hypothetical protein [Candidatus Heimdallarchaeota archaeon]